MDEEKPTLEPPRADDPDWLPQELRPGFTDFPGLVQRTAPRVPRSVVPLKSRPDVFWIKDGRLSIASIYRAPGANFEHFLLDLGRDVLERKLVVLGGDFNAHLGANGDPRTDAEGRALVRWCNTLGLVILNTLPLCKGQYSRVEVKHKARLIERSTVDYVIVSQALLPFVESLHIDPGGQLSSDHRPLVLSMRQPRGSLQAPPPVPRFNWRRIRTDDDRLRLTAGLEEAAERFMQGVLSLDEAAGAVEAATAQHVDNLQALWLLTTYEAAAVTVGRKRQGGRRSAGSWYSQELRALRAKLDRMRGLLLRADAAPGVSGEEKERLWVGYDAAHRAYLTEFRRQKALEELRLNQELMGARSRGDLQAFWSQLRDRRGFFISKRTPTVVEDEKGVLCSGRDAANVWQGVFKRIGTAVDDAEEKIQAVNPLDSGFRADVERRVLELVEKLQADRSLDSPFTTEELEAALGQLRRNVAIGPDFIPNDFLRSMACRAKEGLLLLYNRALQSGSWPADWQLGTILPLFKAGATNRADVNEYRPITLTSCVGKLFEMLLLARLTRHIDDGGKLVEEQGGFRAGRSTLDQIFSLHEIVASRMERKLPTYLAFLDARRAYDRVWLDGLLLRLLEAGVTGQMFRLLRSMLFSSVRQVLVDGEASDPFSTTVGVPQGAVLSPLLYALFINGLAVELKERGFGVDVFGRRVCLLLYADDIVLLADSPGQLQEMLDATGQYASRWQFRFNTKPGKSDVVVCGSKQQCSEAMPEFRLGDGVLQVSTEYKYLGVEFGKVGRARWASYLDRVLVKAKQAADQLAYSVGGGKPLPVHVALQLFNSLVRPRMEYAAEIWAAHCSAGTFEQLDRVQAAFGKRVLRLAWNVSSTYVREELGMPSMRERAMCAMLRFYGHLSKLPDSRLAGFIFRERCKEVDAGGARLSWCLKAQEKLHEFGSTQQWANKAVPHNWRAMLTVRVRRSVRNAALEASALKPNMVHFRTAGRLSLPGALDFALLHPGAMLRVKLRCNALPLSVVVEPAKTTCRLCGGGEVESAAHFVARCPFYAAERARCLERISELTPADAHWALWAAVLRGAPEVFLGDRLLLSLPPGRAKEVDATVCNFLKVAWRKRQSVWRRWCSDKDGWKLVL